MHIRLLIPLAVGVPLLAQISGLPAINNIRTDNRPRAESRAGNSVDTATGAFLVEQEVIRLQGARDLGFSLSYHSLFANNAGPMGLGWTHNYTARLSVEANGDVVIWWDHTRYNTFRPAGGELAPVEEAVRYDKLVRNANGSYRLTRLDGSIFDFTSTGLLTRVGNKVEQFIDVSRDLQSRISSLREPIAERTLTFHYAPDRPSLLQSVVDPHGRTVFFDYDDAGRLRAIRSPATPESNVGIDFSPVAIPDNDPAGVTQTLAAQRDGPVGLVLVESGAITHPRPADLQVYLISPSGRRVLLPKPPLNAEGNLVFRYMVVGDFEGETGAGTWRIQVVDLQPGQTGTLQPWRIALSGPSYPQQLTYDGSNRIVLCTDSQGAQMFALEYDALGRVARQDDGRTGNLVAQFTYQETGNTILTTYSDRAGAEFQFEHDSRYRLLRYTDPLENTIRYEYDSNGNRVRRTDPLGRTVNFTYDSAGNLIQTSDPALALTVAEYDQDRNITRITDALGRSSTFQYDDKNNMTAVTDAKGNRDRRPYNSNSQIAGTLLQDGAGINYTYTAGMPTRASHPVSGNVGSAYDSAGRLIRMTDGDGFATVMEYDDRDNVIQRTDAIGRIRQFVFDHRNRQIRVIEPSGDSIFYSYDQNDNLISKTDPLGRITRYEYDGEDRRTRTIDPLGNAASTTYDAAGRPVAETDASGNTTIAEYDGAGNLLALRNPLGVVVERRTYDVRDNVVESTNALGAKTTTRYDLLGRPFEWRNALNESLLYEYDELDRPTAVRDPLGRTSRREYFEDDVVNSQTGPTENRQRFFYDAANRLTGVETYYGSSRITYNNRDLVTESRTNTSNTGRRTAFTYDGAGQVLSLTRTSPVPTYSGDGETLDYSYDLRGNLTVVSKRESPTGPIVSRLRREWDGAGRLTRVIDEESRAVNYSYDDADRLTRLTYPDGSQVTYTYDDAGRVIRITDWAGRVTRMTWDAASRLTTVTFPNGAQRRMEYDAAGRVLRRGEYSRAGAAIVSIKYSYDATGRLITEAGAVSPTTVPPDFQATATNDNRLATASLLETQQPLGYDQDGNLTSGSLNGTISDFRYDVAGRLISTSPSLYTYDVEDRLSSYRLRTGPIVSLVWSPNSRLGQVLSSTQSGVTTRYVYGVGLMYSERNGQIFVHHFDERGSTVALSGSSGETVGTINYSPYGRIVSRQGQTDTPFLFHGLFGVITTADGLAWMRYRWYSPELRRFLSVDPRYGDIAQPDSLNRYAFLGNSPGLRVDADGEFWWVAVGALVGAVANVAVQVASDVISGKVSDWQTYAGAAVSGAVTGAGLALCPACGLAGGAAIGALGAAAGYLTAQGLRGEQVTAEGLLAEAALGGLAGGAAGGAGRLGSKAIGKLGSKLGPKFLGPLSTSGKAAARRAVYGRLDIATRALKQETGRGLLRGALTGGFSRLAEQTGLGAALENGALTGLAWLRGAVPAAASSIQPTRTRIAADQDARDLVNRDSKGVYGEFLMWNSFSEVLRLAGRPVPDVPGNILTTF